MVANEPIGTARPMRVLHLVSGDAQAPSVERVALRSVLAGIARQSVEAHVVRFAKADELSMALRLMGLPVHDIGPIRQQFSPASFRELRGIAQSFHPQVVHAWDYAAQCASLALRRDFPEARVVWSMTSTRPRALGPDQAWLRAALRDAGEAHAIVYGSRVSAGAHHEAGFPLELQRIVEPGVDAELYKPDFNARRRVRAQLQIPAAAFVVGMYAPFVRHVDHATLIDAMAALAERHSHLQLLLGGTQVEPQNAAFTALLRQAKSLSGRVHAVGRTIDMEDLYGACDAVCSTALNDSRRLDVAAAMLCGVPCIATDVDAQRELLSEGGIAVAVGNAREVEAALASLLAMPATERAALAQRGRQHVLQNYTVKRTVGRYQRLYEKLLDATPGAGCDDI